MPVLYQHRIYRIDLQRNPEVLYLFGDNNARVGMGGQAGEMRNEPNAVGVRTKWLPSHEDRAFFNDRDYHRISLMMRDDLKRAVEHLRLDCIVVIPSDGLGTGLSELPTRAPRLNLALTNLLEDLNSIRV